MKSDIGFYFPLVREDVDFMAGFREFSAKGDRISFETTPIDTVVLADKSNLHLDPSYAQHNVASYLTKPS
jgi:hypothetical protein